MSIHHHSSDFEDIYCAIRNTEGRMYTDDEVASLPTINPQHVHAREWQIRNASYLAFEKYLLKKNRPLNMLDIGCGNGWMTNKLASLPGSAVTGMDVNEQELAQARRVFTSKRLKFIKGSIIDDKPVQEHSFDIIILSASLQYFPDVPALLHKLIPLLKQNGEIHIRDTHFYSSAEIRRAQKNTQSYYQKLQMPQMTDYYHHHAWSTFRSFHYKVRNSFGIAGRFLKPNRSDKNFFPWIIVYASSS